MERVALAVGEDRHPQLVVGGAVEKVGRPRELDAPAFQGAVGGLDVGDPEVDQRRGGRVGVGLGAAEQQADVAALEGAQE